MGVEEVVNVAVVTEAEVEEVVEAVLVDDDVPVVPVLVEAVLVDAMAVVVVKLWPLPTGGMEHATA